MARPIIWDINKTNIAITLILDRISDGESVRTILNEDRDKDLLPSRRVFLKWLIEIDGLSIQYAHACEVRGDAIFDEIIQIADATHGDKKVLENGFEVMDSEFVARSRIRIDARKWVASKLNPKKYGDTVDFTSGGVALTGIDFNVISKK
jgi:hypothetical protein